MTKRAAAAKLVSVLPQWLPIEQRQDILKFDPGANRGKVEPRHARELQPENMEAGSTDVNIPIQRGCFMRACCSRFFSSARMLSIRLASELDRHRIVHDSIESGHDQGRVAHVFRPVGEVNVRDQRRRGAPTARINDFVEQARRVRIFTSLQLVEAELINNQEIERLIIAHSCCQRLVSQRRRQFLE